MSDVEAGQGASSCGGLCRWLKRGGWLLAMVLVYLLAREWALRGVIKGEAPLFVAPRLSGDLFVMKAARGKPLLLHFWATWCPVCKLEQDWIDDLAKDYQVMTVAYASGDADEVAQFMRAEGLSYPVVVDPNGRIAQLYGVRAVPMSFVIDSSGQIASVERGLSTKPGLALRLELAD